MLESVAGFKPQTVASVAREIPSASVRFVTLSKDGDTMLMRNTYVPDFVWG
jgi:hypothetical protein